MTVLRLTLVCLVLAMVQYSTTYNGGMFIRTLRSMLDRDVTNVNLEKLGKVTNTKLTS